MRRYPANGLNQYLTSFREYHVHAAALKALTAMGQNMEGVKTRGDFFHAKDKAEIENPPVTARH